MENSQNLSSKNYSINRNRKIQHIVRRKINRNGLTYATYDRMVDEDIKTFIINVIYVLKKHNKEIHKIYNSY